VELEFEERCRRISAKADLVRKDAPFNRFIGTGFVP
jgi:hypothetical protein